MLILDEPTAVLTPSEARELFKALREFVSRGNAVVFISHKLDEVLEISDRITVLRGGRKVATEETGNCTHKSLAKLMVGHEIVLNDLRGRAAGTASLSTQAVLRLHEVSAHDDLGNVALNSVSLEVRAGEILGIAGVAGNGQKELSQVLTGMRPVVSGRIEVGRERLHRPKRRTVCCLRRRPYSGGPPAQRAGARAQRHRQRRDARIQKTSGFGRKLVPAARRHHAGRDHRRRRLGRGPRFRHAGAAICRAAISKGWSPVAKCASPARC